MKLELTTRPRIVIHVVPIEKKYIYEKYTSAATSTNKEFDQNSALQAACDTSIARVTGCVYPREGYRSVTLLLRSGSTGPRRSAFFCARKLYNPHSSIAFAI